MTTRRYHPAELKEPTFQVGDRLQFVTVSLTESNAVSVPKAIRNWESFRGALLAVGIQSESGFDVLGTAFMLGPGLAVSARHIYLGLEEQLQAGIKVIYLLGVLEAISMIWKVRHLNIQEDRDICLLSIEPASSPPPDGRLGRFAITTRAAKAGELVHLIGFRRSTIDAKGNSIFLGAQLLGARGQVAAVYPKKRDSVLMPFPTIQIDAGSLGGMSGGIVLDQNSKIMGVISSSFETNEKAGPTFAAWIIECLGRRLTVSWPPGIYQEGIRLMEATKPAIVCEGLNAVAINKSGQLEYTTWFEQPPSTAQVTEP